MIERYSADQLRRFAAELLTRSGLVADRALVVAEVLLEGDLLGHTTHGLQLLGPYLKGVRNGAMTLEGEPEVVRDSGAAMVWEGNYLPGPWLVTRAIEAAQARLAEHPMVSVNIRRSHHIGCLQAYLKRVTDRGQMILLLSSDPSVATVAPHGGLKPVCTPNPIAAGIPTEKDPIWIDISMSTTSNGMTMRLHKKGQRLPHAWLKDADGNPTDDPGVMFGERPGTLLPLGGMDLGYKGFALAMLVEALTSALGGHGRADGPDRWGASVFLQLIDPGAFGGKAQFLRETTWLVESCRQSAVRSGESPVRVPGEHALRRRAEQVKNGVELYPGIMESLEKWAGELSVEPPRPLP